MVEDRNKKKKLIRVRGIGVSAQYLQNTKHECYPLDSDVWYERSNKRSMNELEAAANRLTTLADLISKCESVYFGAKNILHDLYHIFNISFTKPVAEVYVIHFGIPSNV
jgi:hypothetical protein